MRGIVYAIIVYIVGAFLFKSCGDMNMASHVNYYWIMTSAAWSFIFFKISLFLKINYFKEKYLKEDLSLYNWILKIFSCYWAVMFIVRVYVAFDIDSYDMIISTSRKISIGASVLAFAYISLFFKILISNDRKEQG